MPQSIEALSNCPNLACELNFLSVCKFTNQLRIHLGLLPSSPFGSEPKLLLGNYAFSLSIWAGFPCLTRSQRKCAEIIFLWWYQNCRTEFECSTIINLSFVRLKKFPLHLKLYLVFKVANHSQQKHVCLFFCLCWFDKFNVIYLLYWSENNLEWL